MKTVLITGASRGIGRAIGQLLWQQGYTVIGTSRQPTQAEATPFELYPLDVSNDESVERCVGMVLSKYGRVNVLINNAGIALYGAVEEATVEDVRRVMETNLLGVVRMTNAVLPHMRAARQGQIINMSSLAGLVGVPYLGIYAASKHALEGYTTTLRYEVRHLGIHVTLIEPGDIRTDIERKQASRSYKDYEDGSESAIAIHEAHLQNGPPPAKVAAVVAKVIRSQQPRLRYSITNGDEFWVPWMRRLLPDWVNERLIRNHFRLE